MTGLALRPYQIEARDAIEQAWSGGMRRPALVLPTGAGKTVVIGDVTRRALERQVGRVLALAHRDELINQLRAKLAAMTGQRVGVVKGPRNETGAVVVCASVQSLRTAARRRQIRDVGLVVVDEAHHATAPTYLDILEHYGCLDGESGRSDGRRALALGVTATMSRGDGVGLGAVWDDVVYERKIPFMLTNGYLVEPRGIRVDVSDLDLDAVGRSRGDWQDGALGAALEDSEAPQRILEAWQEHASDRPTVGFAPTVAFAQVMCDTFRAAGIPTGIVHGEQSRDERRAVWAAVDANQVQVVWNCMVATEGTDVPKWSCAIIARPTGHAALYIQMVGRILRTYPGKLDALVLDVSGVTRRHRLASLVDLIGVEDTTDKVDDDVDAVSEESEFQENVADTPLRDWEDTDLPDGVSRTNVYTVVDLFHGSRLTWLQTAAGAWILPVGNRYIAILPSISEPGAFDVVTMDSWTGGGIWTIERAAPDLGFAQAFGEQSVTEEEATVASRDAAFRTRPILRAHHSRAERLGLNPWTATRGELFAAETRRGASARVDPVYHWAASHAAR